MICTREVQSGLKEHVGGAGYSTLFAGGREGVSKEREDTSHYRGKDLLYRREIDKVGIETHAERRRERGRNIWGMPEGGYLKGTHIGP